VQKLMHIHAGNQRRFGFLGSNEMAGGSVRRIPPKAAGH
jgi:hypothetical protein